MTKIIDRVNWFLNRNLPSNTILTKDDIPWIDERFRSRVVISIMTMQMFSIIAVMALFFWRTNELFSDIYFNYSIAIGLIYAVQIYCLYTSRVSAIFCVKILVLSLLATFCLIFLDPKMQETLLMSRSRIFLLPPFSYIFAGRKFGILTATITFMIYIFSVFLWQSIHTIQTTLFGIFHFLLDLIVPILILERVLDTESGDKQSEEVQGRSVFLRIVSHELRTPIHGILASTEILRGSQLTSAQRSLISAIQSAGTNVIHIADHILRISNTRGFEQRSEQFDLYLACEQISEGMSPFLESQNFDFDFDYKVPFSQSLLIGDIGLLKQIIINSMNNMLNIARDGKVMFTVKAKDEGATPERTDKLTNLFTVEFNLTGIGQILDNVESYIKSLVDSIGGNFEIKKSPEDPNSHESSYTFIITIDLQKAAEENDRISVTKPFPLRYVTEVGADPRISLRVGIIRTHKEDSFIMKEIESILKTDFEMETVQRISIEDIDNERVNTIIFDTSEIEEQVIEEVCQKAKSANVPIILITKLMRTSLVSETVSKSGIKEEKVYFIVKPFTQVKLWNGLIAATNKIKKTESDEVIQKEEKY
ncbi:22736_t:CDS:10 [Rhizophagus irregularis]|nr:22736_t:CDS:10 [Rhizophagus irregularis]